MWLTSVRGGAVLLLVGSIVGEAHAQGFRDGWKDRLRRPAARGAVAVAASDLRPDSNQPPAAADGAPELSGVRRVQATAAEVPDRPSSGLPGTPETSAAEERDRPSSESAGAPEASTAESPTPDPAESRAVDEHEPGVDSEGDPDSKTKGTSDLGPGTLNKLLGLEESPVVVYGWNQNSFTGNTNGTPRNRQNFSVFPNRLANEWQGNQYYLVIENPIEEGDRLNLGFRLDGLLGHDWQFTKSYGLFDRAFTPNSFAGIDLPQMYGEAHLPILTRGGLDLKGGRFYSPAGYDSVMATQRPLLSVANSLNFTPFTFFGMLTTLHVSDRFIVHNGTVNGADRWIDENYRWNYLGGYHWTSPDGRTTLKSHVQVGPNQLPRFAPVDSPFLPTGVVTTPRLQRRVDPFYPDHFRTYNSNVVTHQWTEKWTEAAEVFFVVEPDVPGLGPGGRPRDSAWYGFVHWYLYEFDPKLTGVWRFEIFRDEAGAAIGVADWFYETTIGLKYTPRPWLWIRPEARYDWAQFKTPYSDGTRGSQLTLAFDVILLY